MTYICLAINAGNHYSADKVKLGGAGNSDLNTEVKKVIDKISSKFKVNGECDGFAKQLVKGLEKEEIKYEIIRIDSKAEIYSDKVKDVIGQGYHYGRKVGDMIYDNMTLNGMTF